MAVGYRTVLTVEPRDNSIEIAREAVTTWLRDKVVSAGPTAIQAAAGLSFSRSFRQDFGPSLAVTNTIVNDGEGRTQQLIRLDETHTPGETWRVNVTATRNETEGRREQSISLEVDPLHLKGDDAVMQTAIPRLVRGFFANSDTRFRSGATRVTDRPLILKGDEGALQARRAIFDPARRISVVVASALPQVKPDIWAEAVRALTHESVGVSTSLVLDERALERLNTWLPEWLQLKEGEVRTFAPEVDRDEEQDGLRHRRLGPESFQRHLSRHPKGGELRVDKTFARVHARRPRTAFLDHPAQEDLRPLARLVLAEELRVEREAAIPQEPVRLRLEVTPSTVAWPRPVAPPTAPTPSATDATSHAPSPDEENSSTGTIRPDNDQPLQTPAPQATESTTWLPILGELMSELMDAETVDETSVALLVDHVRTSARRLAAIERQLTEALAKQEETELALHEARAERDDLELSFEDVEHELNKAAHQSARLLQQAIDEQKWERIATAAATTVWDDVPESVEELVRRLDGGPAAPSPHVMFTGDDGAASAIDLRDHSGRYCRMLWAYVEVLDNYAHARAKGFEGGVHQYLQSDEVSGFKCTPSRHASTESDSVQQNRSWRDERLLPVPSTVDPSGKTHMFAHFKTSGGGTFAPRLHYFDDTANTGKIYIGYIGRHLTNTRTASI